MGAVFSGLEHAFARFTSYAGSTPADVLLFEGKDGLLYANGKQFHIKGANW